MAVAKVTGIVRGAIAIVRSFWQETGWKYHRRARQGVQMSAGECSRPGLDVSSEGPQRRSGHFVSNIPNDTLSFYTSRLLLGGLLAGVAITGGYCWSTLRIVLDDLKSDKIHPCCRYSGSG